MEVKIDDLDLIKRTDDSDSHVVKEIRAVRNISLNDRSAIVELKIPGSSGSILQDLGRKPIVVKFLGEIHGEDAKTSLESLRTKFNAGKPLPFSSDLSGVAEVTQVLVDDLQIDESLGSSNRFIYTITVREFIEPKEEEAEEPPSQDDEAADAVDDETDDAITTVNRITGKVVDEEKKPEPNVKVKITDEKGNEFEETTNDDGIYRKDDLEPGKYTVTVDAKGYERKKQHVEIKKPEGGGAEEGGDDSGGAEAGGGGESEEEPSDEASSEEEPSNGDEG